MADTTPISERVCPFDLTELTRDQQVVYDWAYQTGYLHGHEAGWLAADAHANFLTRRAAEIVHAAADLPEHDPEGAVARDEYRRRLGNPA